MGESILGFYIVVSLIVSAVASYKYNHPKTKTCRYCHREVDGRAKACPYCGRNIGTHPVYFFPFILAFMGMMVLAMVVLGGIGSLLG